jgi:regulator of protease activity HflC (stomatin/prohibitin superfamily)
MGVIVNGLAVVVLVAGVLVMMSLDQVEQNQFGLVFNWVTKSIGTKVYHGGTHFIGFWNTFVTFPATVMTIEFSTRVGLRTSEALHTRTKEGLGLHLSIAFQYKLNPSEIPQLYALTNDMYESLYTRIARDQLLEAASEYEGPQYWLERKTIGDHMRRLVDGELARSHAELWGLQLLVIDLPDQYEMSITMTQVQQQMVRTRRNEQIAASIRADTEVLQASFRNKIQVVQASADANYTLITKLADAEAEKRKISAEAEILGYARDKMKLTALGAVEYQQLSAYAGLENATFLANVMPTPVINSAPKSGPGLVKMIRQHDEEDQADKKTQDGDADDKKAGEAESKDGASELKPVGSSTPPQKENAPATRASDSKNSRAQAFLGFFSTPTAPHVQTSFPTNFF